MTDLTKMKCVPCEGGTPPLGSDQVAELLKELPEDWQVIDEKKIKKRFSFKDFAEALKFVNSVGEIAEQEGHHPDITFGWGYASIQLTTHAIGGLSENDFILAAKIEEL